MAPDGRVGSSGAGSGSVVLVGVLVRVGMITPAVVTGPGFLAFSTLAVVVVAALAAVVVVAAFGGHPLAAAARLTDAVVRMDGAFREPFALVGAAAGPPPP